MSMYSSGPVASRERLLKINETALTTIPDLTGAEVRVREKFSASESYGEIHKYAVDESEVFNQEEFALGYVSAAQKIVDKARSFLQSNLSVQALQQIKNSVPLGQTPYAALSKIQSEDPQRSYERLIRVEIMRLAMGETSDSDPELLYRAASFALMTIQQATERVMLEELLSSKSHKLAAQKEIMMKARQRISDGGSASDLIEAFVSIVHEQYGYLPRLRVVSDYDGNLTYTAHQGSPRKPGEVTNQLLNEVEKLMGLDKNYSVRLVLSECPGTSSTLRSLARAAYHQVHAENVVLSDTAELFSLLTRSGIEHVVFTANHEGVPIATINELELTASAVVGLSEGTYYASKVEWLLLQVLLSDKIELLIMSDDDEGSLARHISRDREQIAAQYGTENAYLPDLILFASRIGAPPGGRTFRIGDALTERAIPFLRNSPTSESDKGLEALIHGVERYLTIRNSRMPKN